MATKKYIKNKLKSRRRRNRKTRLRTKQSGGCVNGQCMTGGDSNLKKHTGNSP